MEISIQNKKKHVRLYIYPEWNVKYKIKYNFILERPVHSKVSNFFSSANYFYINIVMVLQEEET